MRTIRFATSLATTLFALAVAPLAAMDSHIVGPRALGMGGTGTAAADDHTASYWNPAIYGFFSRTGEEDAKLDADPNNLGRKDWGLGLVDVNIGLEQRGELADWVQQLDGADLGRLGTIGGANATPEDLKTAMIAANLLQNFDAKADNAIVIANAGVLDLRILHIGIGIRQYVEGVVSIADLDRVNVGFGTNTPAILAGITDPSTTPAGWTPSYTPTLITGASADAVAQALGAADYATASATVQEAVSKLDYAAGQAGLSSDQVAALAGTGGVLNLALTATGSIDNNQTAVFTGGYSLTEIPLSIGYAINDHFSVGGNLKLMIGRLAAAKVRLLSDTSDLSSLLRDAFDESTQTVTGGIDLGFAARCSWAQAGLTVRNLNRPVLKGATFHDADGQPFTVADVDLDPQVALGVAVYPWETLCLTADIDLTENSTVLKTTSGRTLTPGIDPELKIAYATQRLGAGAEWNVLHFLALRGGVSQDLAESEVGMILHGGLGLNLWAVRLDLAGAMSTKTVTVDGTEYPRAFNVGAGLTVDF